jgi:hypothetical protein
MGWFFCGRGGGEKHAFLRNELDFFGEEFWWMMLPLSWLCRKVGDL